MIYSYNDFINESKKNLKYVYHVLDYEKLDFVLRTNTIASKHFANISTSRNPHFSNYIGDTVTSWFKLELDYQKLNKVYKNREFVYVSRTNVSMPGEEEQQFLTNEISPALDYITKFILIQSRLENSMYSRLSDKGKGKGYSDWMTDAPRPRRKIPEIIKEFYDRLKKIGRKLYVQKLNGEIVEDDKYIQKIINTPLTHVDIYYGYVYRKNKYVKLHSTEDVIYDPFIKKEHRIVLGYEYPKKDFKTLARSIDELKKKYPNLKKEFKETPKMSVADVSYYKDLNSKFDMDDYLPIENNKLYIVTLRDVSKDKFYLEDSKPYDW